MGHYPLDPKQVYDPVVHDASDLILAVFRLENPAGKRLLDDGLSAAQPELVLPNPEADFSYAACEKRWSTVQAARAA